MTANLRHQRTIACPARVAGFGYWSGHDVRVEFRPAPADSGIVFVRGDLDPPVRISACVRNRIEVPRRTTLAVGGTRVDMVEHIMAALAGLHIDNCEVWTDQAEMPGCDGSSQAFVEALLLAGIVTQEKTRRRRVVTQRVRVGDDSCWVEARPHDFDGLYLQCLIDYGTTGPIRRQTFRLVVTPETFCRELARARTFILEQEAEWLRQQGLGRRVTNRDLLVFDEHGPMDNPLRFEDECVRHKTLDMVGDLALAGCDLVGHFIAHCSGHRLNAELIAAMSPAELPTCSYRKTA
ncbi:MAG: UDP-3-O-acyl-N-acetylglucosamine deacetylase [Planctomycetes bacterium]|nr:UDP-3-O-acyl-N-acetylglucosamine deacetylase [Planctomycetota bacterium]